MEKIVIAVMWFFIIMGAVIVTKISLFNMDPEDTTSIFLGLTLINIVWITVGVELKKLLNK